MAGPALAGGNDDIDAGFAALNQRHNPAEAIALFNEALADSTLTEDKKSLALLDRGQAYAASGDLARAIEDYNTALPNSAVPWAIHLDRGIVYAELGQSQDALADYAMTLKLKPENPMAFTKRGEVYLALGRLAEARADEDRAIELKTDDPKMLKVMGEIRLEALGIRGMIRRRQGDNAGAITDLTLVLGEQPNPHAYLERGSAELAVGRVDPALDDLDHAISLAPDSTDAHHSRGNLRAALGGYASALEDLDEAVRLAPKDGLVRRDRGAVFFNEGDFAAAANEFDRAAQLAPADPYALIWRHLAKTRLKQDEAAEFTSAAVGVDAAAWPAPVVAMFRGQVTPADVLSAARQAPDNDRPGHLCEAFYYVGQAALMAGDERTAVTRLHKAVEICPLDYIERGAAEAELRRLER